MLFFGFSFSLVAARCCCMTAFWFEKEEPDDEPLGKQISKILSHHQSAHEAAVHLSKLLCDDPSATIARLNAEIREEMPTVVDVALLGKRFRWVRGSIECFCSLDVGFIETMEASLETLDGALDKGPFGATSPTTVAPSLKALFAAGTSDRGSLCNPTCKSALQSFFDDMYGFGKAFINPSLLVRILPKAPGTAVFDCLCSGLDYDHIVDIALEPLLAMMCVDGYPQTMQTICHYSHSMYGPISMAIDGPAYADSIRELAFGPRAMCSDGCRRVVDDVRIITRAFLHGPHVSNVFERNPIAYYFGPLAICSSKYKAWVRFQEVLGSVPASCDSRDVRGVGETMAFAVTPWDMREQPSEFHASSPAMAEHCSLSEETFGQILVLAVYFCAFLLCLIRCRSICRCSQLHV